MVTIPKIKNEVYAVTNKWKVCQKVMSRKTDIPQSSMFTTQQKT